MADLLPCPFCGGDVSIACEQAFWTVRCADEMCPAATTNGAFPKKFAIAAWNSRAALPKGEPVAWQRKHQTEGWIFVRPEDIEHYRAQGQNIRPLFAAPPAGDER